jgi:hypothetical protein
VPPWRECQTQAEDWQTCLKIEKGCITPLTLINANPATVTFVVDETLATGEAPLLICAGCENPLVGLSFSLSPFAVSLILSSHVLLRMWHVREREREREREKGRWVLRRASQWAQAQKII